MSWRGIKGAVEAAQSGHDVVMTPTTFAYLDYNQGDQSIDPPIYASLRVKKSYSFEPVPEGVDAKYILGGQFTTKFNFTFYVFFFFFFTDYT